MGIDPQRFRAWCPPAGAGHPRSISRGDQVRRALQPLIASKSRGFSLIELLVVVAIVSLLLAILLPGLAASRRMTRRTMCLANLHSLGTAVHLYAANNAGCIPFGPKAPRPLTATEFYPSTGAPTSLISLRVGKPVGAGLMLSRELAKCPQALFCPDSDQPVDANAELAKVGRTQAQGSYYYRHASVTRRYDLPGTDVLSPKYIRLENLGKNRDGRRIQCLAIDTQFLVPPEFDVFGIRPRTHHGLKVASVLRADGRAEGIPNRHDRFTINLDTYDKLQDAFGEILRALEQAD
jgi:prepilin-type N-terminal cleavage/methylation domain-containing protein